MQTEPRVTIKQSNVFIIGYGDKELHGMHLVSEWEGFKKYVNVRGETLITLDDHNSPYRPFARLFAESLEPTPTQAIPIAASPAIWDALGLIQIPAAPNPRPE